MVAHTRPDSRLNMLRIAGSYASEYSTSAPYNYTTSKARIILGQLYPNHTTAINNVAAEFKNGATSPEEYTVDRNK